MAQETQTFPYQPREFKDGKEMKGGSKGVGYLYLWLTHVEICQKTEIL